MKSRRGQYSVKIFGDRKVRKVVTYGSIPYLIRGGVMDPYVPQFVMFSQLSIPLACFSFISIKSFMRSTHAFREGGTVFQNQGMSCLAAHRKKLRRFVFWDLIEPVRMERSAILGEGVRDSSYISLYISKISFQNGQIWLHSHQICIYVPLVL